MVNFKELGDLSIGDISLSYAVYDYDFVELKIKWKDGKERIQFFYRDEFAAIVKFFNVIRRSQNEDVDWQFN